MDQVPQSPTFDSIAESDGTNDLQRLISSDSVSSDYESNNTAKQFIENVFHTNNEPNTNEVEIIEQIETRKRESSTYRVINDNIINGWKHAVETGNDSLCLTMFGDYKDYRNEFINVTFNNGDNSLHVACKAQCHRLIYFLLNHCQMDVNNINPENGNTALHYSCQLNDITSIKLLLFKFNGNPNIVNKNGTSVIDIAKTHHYSQMEKIIARAMRHMKNNSLKFETESQCSHQTNAEKSSSHSSSSSSSSCDSDLVSISLGGRSDFYNNGISESSSSSSASESESESESDTESETAIENENENGNEYESKDKMENNEYSFENERKQLELSKLAKRNPFRNPYRKIVDSNDNSVSKLELYDPICKGNEIYLKKKNELPFVYGWLWKRRPRAPHNWQKRWVIVKDNHIFWNDKYIPIENFNTIDQIKLNFSGWVQINTIKELIVNVKAFEKEKEKGKNKNKNKNDDNVKINKENKGKKFIVIARNAKTKDGTMREYLWKCKSRQERDFWIMGLRQHIDFIKEAQKYDIF